METETKPAISDRIEDARPVTNADRARLTTTLAQPDSAATKSPQPTVTSVVRICETWPQRVRAARYTDLDSLKDINAWVRALDEDKQLQPGVQFAVEADDGLPAGVVRGVLYDRNADPLHRWVVLRCGWYLVHHGDKKLEVLDEHTFHSRYRYPERVTLRGCATHPSIK